MSDKIPHYGRKLSNDREVWLGRFDKGYSIIFNRPIKDDDLDGLPEYVSICDDKVMTKLSLSKEAMSALIDLYINQDYDQIKKTIFIYDESDKERF